MKIEEIIKAAWDNGRTFAHDCKTSHDDTADYLGFLDDYEDEIKALSNQVESITNQVELWQKDSEDNVTAFRKAGMKVSQFSSGGMAQAYRNVIQFIDVNINKI